MSIDFLIQFFDLQLDCVTADKHIRSPQAKTTLSSMAMFNTINFRLRLILAAQVHVQSGHVT
jgi:hypothetical protein